MKRMMVLPRTMPLLLAVVLMGWVLSAAAQDAAKPAEPAAAAAAPAGMKDLNAELKLPRALFIGTPTKIESPNLDKTKIGVKRTSFFVPKDIQLISLKKDVTASDKEPIIGEISLITDGDKEGSDGSFVEMAPGVQWVQLDLKQPTDLFATVFWHYHAQARVYHDVIVKCADDADFTKNVKTLYNNDHDNSAGQGIGKDKEYIETNEGKLVDCKDKDGKPVKARYLRFYSNGNTSNEMNHYIEIEVYGNPAK